MRRMVHEKQRKNTRRIRKKERERESPVERNINDKVKRIGKRQARNVKLIQSAKQVEV